MQIIVLKHAASVLVGLELYVCMSMSLLLYVSVLVKNSLDQFAFEVILRYEASDLLDKGFLFALTYACMHFIIAFKIAVGVIFRCNFAALAC